MSDMRGYSRRTSYVRRPCAGRKFRRKSTTPTEMSYDLLSFAYIWKTFLSFLPFLSFLVVAEDSSPKVCAEDDALDLPIPVCCLIKLLPHILL